MADTLEQTIARERENLTEKRKEILAKQKELDKQLAELDREFTTVAAYEAAKKVDQLLSAVLPQVPAHHAGKDNNRSLTFSGKTPVASDVLTS